jgi:hypothetical protein
MKIILFNAPPRSGKDTAVEGLYKKLTFEYDYGANDYALVWHFKMAEPLKYGVHHLLGLDKKPEYFEPVKDKPNPLLFGKTPRECYIDCAENYLKPLFGKDVFGHIFVNRLKIQQKLETPRNELVVLCSDVGFVDEVMPVIKYVGEDNVMMIKLYRDGCDYSKDSRSYVDIPGIHTTEIHNNGTKDQLINSCFNSIDGWLHGIYG